MKRALLALAGLGLLHGCYPNPSLIDGPSDGGSLTEEEPPPSELDAGSEVVVPLDDGGMSSSTPDASVPPAASGLPCALSEMLTARCAGCHGASPSAPMSLVTRENLMAASQQMPGSTYAQAAASRARDSARPMPPAGLPAVTDAELAVLQGWISEGYPAGRCGETPTDGGTSTPTDAGMNPFNTPPMCSSGTYWRRGNDGSQLMHPGGACITCHTAERQSGEDDAPLFSIAGTVFPTAHEPTDCNGLPGPSVMGRVEITDANGTVHTLPINSAGNFMSRTNIAKPYRAKVVTTKGTRQMGAAQTNGNCNSCHTQNGLNGAPGRVVAP